jgi:hypothetical protein
MARDVARREGDGGTCARPSIPRAGRIFSPIYSTPSTNGGFSYRNELVIRSTKNGAMLSIPSVSTRFSVSSRFFL